MKHGGILLEPEWTKNRKPGFIALPDALLKELQRQKKGKHATRPLLQVPTHTARMLDRDLQAAGIPKNTDEGKIDFHVFRTTFTTLVIESGANPKEAQELARHSTPDLTMNTYARARSDRLADITDSVAEGIGIGCSRVSEEPQERAQHGSAPKSCPPQGRHKVRGTMCGDENNRASLSSRNTVA